MYKLRGIGEEPRRFIEALQPYADRQEFYCRGIRAVHEFSNLDKHRLVHLWGLRFGDERVRWEPEFDADCEITANHRVLQDGDTLFTIECRSPHPVVKLKGQIGATVAFAGGGGEHRESLWDITLTIRDVVSKLTRAIGHQDQPISLTDWSPRRDAPSPTE
jgi:hypothetical protein